MAGALLCRPSVTVRIRRRVLRRLLPCLHIHTHTRIHTLLYTISLQTLLGQIDLAFLGTYAIGMFFAGHLGDRLDLRWFLTVGE